MRGKILCYGAIIRSGQANAEQLGDILQKLVSLSAKRSYLAIPAHKIVIEGFQQVCWNLNLILMLVQSQYSRDVNIYFC